MRDRHRTIRRRKKPDTDQGRNSGTRQPQFSKWLLWSEILQGLEGTMFNWKAQECVQVFAVSLAVGTFLALAAVIPA
jgi:hypothetical protein